MLCGLASVSGLIEFDGLGFGLHCMVMVCLGDFVRVGETGFVEGLVFLGLHWKRGFSLGVVCGLGVGVGLGIEPLGTHLYFGCALKGQDGLGFLLGLWDNGCRMYEDLGTQQSFHCLP